MREMAMKTTLLWGVVAAVTLAVSGPAVSAEVKGTVAKIEGKTVTVKDDRGKETPVQVKDTAGIKVGDKVEIKDGVVTGQPTAPPKRRAPGYQ